jgi:hypothetical protein
MKLSSLALAFAAAVLCFAVLVQSRLVVPKLSSKTVAKSLQGCLPEKLPGWNVEELPVGPTEVDRTSISRRLNYDQLVFRQYNSAKGSFSLYAAYWGPQKMSPNLVGGHTPDRCWVLCGWNCEKSSFSWKSRLGDQELFPAQYRLFRNAAGQIQHVIYWHLVGGKPFEGNFRIDGSRSLMAYGKSILLHHVGGNTEQFFIRLNSERPFEEIWDDPGFHCLMESLARLGLAESRGKT